MSKYRRRLQTLDGGFREIDGPALVSFEGELILAGGWNGNDTPSTKKSMWKSADGGVVWTDMGDATWPEGKHTFGHGVKDGKVWFWGADYQATNKRQVWTYDSTNGHQLITSDWGNGVGSRILFSSCIHKNYLYVAGGQDDIAAGAGFFNNVYRSLDGVTWTKVADLPAGLQSRSTAAMVSFFGHLYLIGGGIYNSSGHTVYYNDMWKSEDDGLTWTQELVDDRLISIFPNGCAFDGRIWYLKGGKPGGGNTPGLYNYTPATGELRVVNYDIPARHAAGMCEHNGSLHVVAGNLAGGPDCRNDSYKIIKLG